MAVSFESAGLATQLCCVGCWVWSFAHQVLYGACNGVKEQLCVHISLVPFIHLTFTTTYTSIWNVCNVVSNDELDFPPRCLGEGVVARIAAVVAVDVLLLLSVEADYACSCTMRSSLRPSILEMLILIECCVYARVDSMQHFLSQCTKLLNEQHFCESSRNFQNCSVSYCCVFQGWRNSKCSDCDRLS